LYLACLSLTDAGFIWTGVELGAEGRFVAGNARRGAATRIDALRIIARENVREGRETSQRSFALSGVWAATGGGIDPIIGRWDAIAFRHLCSPPKRQVSFSNQNY
jgi:hypothetical protein